MYDLNLPQKSPEQYAIRVIAEIIDRARKDVRGTYQKTLSPTCDGLIYHPHLAKECAIEFTDRVDEYIARNPDADSIEIALEVLTWLL